MGEKRVTYPLLVISVTVVLLVIFCKLVSNEDMISCRDKSSYVHLDQKREILFFFGYVSKNFEVKTYTSLCFHFYFKIMHLLFSISITYLDC